MNPTEIADELEQRAAALGTPERAEKERAYLKLPDWQFHGCTVPKIRSVAREWARAHRDLDRRGLLALVDGLWPPRVWERRRLAVELLVAFADRLKPEDLERVEALLRDSQTWALVDELAVFVAGGLVTRFPELGSSLDRWATDDDFWIRRAAMLALLDPLRKGGGDFERFARYADSMLHEKEFFIRKTIGWILRDTGRKRPELVVAWLSPRTHRAAGLTVREAVKHLPEDDKERLLAAYKAGDPAA